MAIWFIPLIIKGGLVAAKYLATHHAATTVAAKTAVVATKTVGAAQAATATAAALTVVGAYVWTTERFEMAKKAIVFFDQGLPLQAANEITRILRSCYQVTDSDVIDDIRRWEQDGGSISSPAFQSIVSDLRQVVDEMALTARAPA